MVDLYASWCRSARLLSGFWAFSTLQETDWGWNWVGLVGTLQAKSWAKWLFFFKELESLHLQKSNHFYICFMYVEWCFQMICIFLLRSFWSYPPFSFQISSCFEGFRTKKHVQVGCKNGVEDRCREVRLVAVAALNTWHCCLVWDDLTVMNSSSNDDDNKNENTQIR